MAFLKVGKKSVFCQFLKNPSNGIDMSLTWVLCVHGDVIEVKNDKNIEFLGQDLVNIALETGRYIRQPKKHYLIFEVVVSSPESRLPFIALFYPHLMVSTCEVKLGESFCST